MGHPYGTVYRLKELRSMYFEHQKGLRNEFLVEKDLRQRGWRIVAKRFKSPFAEIDLIVEKNKIVKILEIKSLSHQSFSNFRVSARQRVRLARAHQYFIEKWENPVEFQLAFVDPKGRIDYLDLY